MTTIRELVTKIGFDVDTKSLDGFESAIKGVQRSIIAVGAVAAGFAAGLFTLAKNVSNVGDEIAKSSQELGLSTDAFQEWRYAASQAGISQDELATSVRMFSRNIGNAATSGTGPFVERMQQLGVSLTNASGKLKTNDELLLEVSDALTKVKDASVRGAIAQEFFGRSGLRMATFLSAGSQEMKLLRQRARDLGLVLDNDTIKSAEEFNDRLEEVGDVIKAVKNQVGAALIPAIREVVMGFLDWFLVNRKILTQNLQKFVVGLTEIFRVMWDFINKLVTAFNDFAKMVGGTTNAVLALIAAFALVKFSPLIAGLFGLAQGIGAVARAAFAVQGSILLIPIAVILFTTALGMGIQALLEFFGVIDESGNDSMTVWEMLKLSVYAFVGSLGVLVAVKIVGWLSSLAAAAFSATAAFWSMTAPFIVLGLLIGVVAYGLYKLYNILDDYLGGKLTENIKKAWEGLKNYFVKFFTGLGDWITSKFGGIIDSVLDKMKWVRQQLQKMGFGQNDEEMGQKLTAITENKIAMDDPRMAAARESYFPGQDVKPGGMAYQMLKNVAMQSSRVPTMPGVASSQIVRNGNEITNNNRPVNMNSNVTVNMSAAAGTSNQIADITNAVKLAWQEETQRFVENGLFNSAELE